MAPDRSLIHCLRARHLALRYAAPAVGLARADSRQGFRSDSGRFVNIVNVVPIYAEELALAQRGDGVKGIRELLHNGRFMAATAGGGHAVCAPFPRLATVVRVRPELSRRARSALLQYQPGSEICERSLQVSP